MFIDFGQRWRANWQWEVDQSYWRHSLLHFYKETKRGNNLLGIFFNNVIYVCVRTRACLHLFLVWQVKNSNKWWKMIWEQGHWVWGIKKFNHVLLYSWPISCEIGDLAMKTDRTDDFFSFHYVYSSINFLLGAIESQGFCTYHHSSLEVVYMIEMGNKIRNEVHTHG